jgi:hypothetical protein
VNLDPAAEEFDFEPDVDIKNLINLDDAMEELGLGPNGGMMACFECAALIPRATPRIGWVGAVANPIPAGF